MNTTKILAFRKPLLIIIWPLAMHGGAFIKPHEFAIDFFMNMAWNPDAFDASNLEQYALGFCAQRQGMPIKSWFSSQYRAWLIFMICITLWR